MQKAAGVPVVAHVRVRSPGLGARSKSRMLPAYAKLVVDARNPRNCAGNLFDANRRGRAGDGTDQHDLAIIDIDRDVAEVQRGLRPQSRYDAIAHYALARTQSVRTMLGRRTETVAGEPLFFMR